MIFINHMLHSQKIIEVCESKYGTKKWYVLTKFLEFMLSNTNLRNKRRNLNSYQLKETSNYKNYDSQGKKNILD